MSYWLAWLSLAALLCLSVRRIWLVRRTCDWLEQHGTPSPGPEPVQEPQRQVDILIPCRDVGLQARKTIEWFSQLAVPGSLRVRFFVLVAGKETATPPTWTVAEGCIRELDLTGEFFVIRCPGGARTKGELVTFAVSQLDSLSYMPHYFGIYDFDSRPDRRTLLLLGSLLDENLPEVIQQPSLYTAPVAWRLSTLDAIAQSLWTLSFELPLWTRQRTGSTPMHYVVGHGLFLSRSVLARFPLPGGVLVEDLTYGYRLWCEGIRPTILPCFDVAGVPALGRELLRQKAKWYCGSLQALLDSLPAARLPQYVGVARRGLMDLWWLAEGIVVPLGLPVLFAYGFGWGSLCAVVGLYLLHFCVPVGILAGRQSRLVGECRLYDRRRLLTAYLLGWLWYPAYSVGPLCGLVLSLWHGSCRAAMDAIGVTQMDS